MKTQIKLILAFLLLVFFTSCNKASEKSFSADSAQTLSLEAPPKADDNIRSENYSKNTTTDSAEYQRKLTKTGDLRFRTSNLAKTKEAIVQSVTEMKGYVSNDNSSQEDNNSEYRMTIRIPSQNFEKLLDKISSDASKIDYKNVQVEDVTQQFIDLDKRIKTKKELEARYIQLLQKATKVEEILKIEEQIGNLRADIESAEGQFRYLNNQINFSTLTVTFYENNRNFGFWYKLGQGFKNGWSNILWVFVGLANLWAIILFVVLLFYVIRYFRRKRKAKKMGQE